MKAAVCREFGAPLSIEDVTLAVYGHEAAGLVSKVGSGVAGFQVGDPVCVTLIRSCGNCRACSRGQTSECAQPWDKSGSP